MTTLMNDWSSQLDSQFEQPYYQLLNAKVEQEYLCNTVYPEKSQILSALQLTSWADTKVVILGQDPYHGPNQAHGLSFSVKPGIKAPPSLRNILKELQSDVGCYIPNNGYLNRWAEQGVLLLNTVLTVREGCPNSHKMLGWELFTDQVIAALNRRGQPIVFILWGSHAQAKLEHLDTDRHCVIVSPHPSPLSAHRGFFGSKPFSKTNDFLKSIGSTEIDWQIPNIQP